jgi:GDSL-like Lipase/Acylhydrolase family
MKTIIKAVTVVSLALLALVVTEKIFNPTAIGPGSILAVSLLFCLFAFSLISLLVYRTHKNFVENSWLVLLSVVTTYFISDLVAGHLLINPISPPLLHDPYVHHRLKPNTTARMQIKDSHYTQKTNSIGLRGREIHSVKNADTFRILMLGDSFTMGKGVNDDETFSVLLEQALNSKKNAIKGKSTVEVLNAGVDSYAPILEFLQLTKELSPLDPDLVVLNFDVGDLIQETAYRKAATHGVDGEIVGVSGIEPLGPVATMKHWIDQNFYLTRLALFYVDRLSGPSEPTIENVVTLAHPEILEHTLAEDSVDRTAQWQNVFASITGVKAYCDSHHSDFLLTVYPWGHQVNETEWVPGRREFVPDHAIISDKSIDTIQDFGRNHSIEVLNVFPKFRAYNGAARLYFKYDLHWTSQGHKLMAEELEEYMERRYFPVSRGITP